MVDWMDGQKRMNEWMKESEFIYNESVISFECFFYFFEHKNFPGWLSISVYMFRIIKSTGFSSSSFAIRNRRLALVLVDVFFLLVLLIVRKFFPHISIYIFCYTLQSSIEPSFSFKTYIYTYKDRRKRQRNVIPFQSQ